MERHSKATVVDKHRQQNVGKIFETANFGPLRVIAYEGAYRVTVEFINTGTILTNVQMEGIKRGTVRDENLPTIFGCCFLGVGTYKSSYDGKPAVEYKKWKEMLERCFNDRYKTKYPTYQDCFLNPIWYNFQNFAKWYWGQKGAGDGKWNLDKDLLCKGNKEYGPDTCCLVPQEVNNALLLSRRGDKAAPVGTHQRPNGAYVVGKVGEDKYVGYFNSAVDAFNAYKFAKENHLQSLAEKYKNDVDIKVYEALYKFKIEITD